MSYGVMVFIIKNELVVRKQQLLADQRYLLNDNLLNRDLHIALPFLSNFTADR